MFDRLEDIVKHYEELMFELNNPSVAEDQKRFRKLMKEQSDLTPLVETYKEYKQAKQDVEDSLALLEEESDEEMREMAKEELSDAKKRIEELEQQLKILLLPKDPNDDKNVIVEIRAGAGGDEAALFASELYRMYVHYAERQRWKVELINVSESGIGGMKEVEFMITGQGAYSKLKYESGVHRVQRVPETESGGRIHTSTATVAIMPEAEEFDVVIDEKDIRIDVMRASGNGGQCVNTTDSAVRLTHIPTGIVIYSQTEKSQLQNKENCLRMLRSKLVEIKEREHAIHMYHAKGHVRFENVSFGYAPNRMVLQEFDLDVEPGLKVALVGPSGSGKSTIASLLMRFFDVTNGRILLDGEDIRDLSLDSLRRNVGIVLQESFLFSGTIEENIRYGKQETSFEEVVEAAKMANAYEFIRELPLGFRTEVGENGVSLSGGQKQRIAIARTVLHNPSVLILDEATSALDTISEAVVQQALDKLMANRTTIIIAHRLSTVRNADRIVVLKDGRIAQSGRHEELLCQDGPYRRLYAMQLKEQKEQDSPNYAAGRFGLEDPEE